jgi:hypothetical protein
MHFNPGNRFSDFRRRRWLPGLVVPISATLALTATLSGCASLSEDDCLTADWAVMGEADGQQGLPVSEINRYRRQCAQYGVVPDTQAYLEARERGLALFCTHDNGYAQGRSGAGHRLVCPAAVEPDFRRGYDLGRAVYVPLTDLRNSNDSIGYNEDEIAGLRSDIANREEALRADDLTDEEKRDQRDAIASSERRIKELKDDIVMLKASATISIVQYRNAVEAARREGHDEPMEADLLQQILLLLR